MLQKLFSSLQSLLILSALSSTVYLFYFHNSPTLGSFSWKFLAVTLLTDFLYLVLHLFRRPIKHGNLSFDPSKLTVVIICYNGEDIVGETIENAKAHVPPEQIVVVSDASTDKTAQVAFKYGVKVFVNKRNINKAFSISNVMKWVKTPYVLILDDDTLIGKAFIPTSLLDEGYSAVAFNVMPVPTGKILNKLQTYEYRKSMYFSKNLRAKCGAIGNVSGAIGLYWTKDLQAQASLHSGQFGGEDQQRTALVHLYAKGKGVTYMDSLVETMVPATLKSLIKQRSLRWNLSLPELFTIYWRILLSPRQHFLLKLEKAYQMFLYTTDPIRVTLIWVAILYPWKSAILFVFYLFLSLATWLKLGCKDPIWVVLTFPLYRQAEAVCRLVAHFYWFKIKFRYLVREKFHLLVPNRPLIFEYGLVAVCIVVIWMASVVQANSKFTTYQQTWHPPSTQAYVPEPVPFDSALVESIINQHVLPAVTSPVATEQGTTP